VIINQLTLLLFILSMITMLLAMYAWKWKESQVVMALSLNLAALSVWSFGYGLEVVLTSLAHVKAPIVLQYFGIATVPPLYLYFATRYINRDKFIDPIKTNSS